MDRVQWGHLAIVRCLLHSGLVDPAANRLSVLRVARVRKHHDVVKFLMSDNRIVEALLDAFCDVCSTVERDEIERKYPTYPSSDHDQ